MNRRELFQKFAAGLAVAGVAAKQQPTVYGMDLADQPDRTVVVIRCRGHVTKEQRARISAGWKKACAGSAWSTTPVIVHDESIDIYEMHLPPGETLAPGATAIRFGVKR